MKNRIAVGFMVVMLGGGCSSPLFAQTNEALPSYGYVSPPSYDSPSATPQQGTPSLPEESAEEKSGPIDIQALLKVTQASLTDMRRLNNRINAQGTPLKFFGIDKKSVQSQLTHQISTFQIIERALKQGDGEEAQRLSDEQEELEADSLNQLMPLLQKTYESVKKVPNKEIQKLLVNAFKPVRESMSAGDFGDAREAVDLYMSEFKKNQKLYSTKKLTNAVKKQITAALKKFASAIAEQQNEMAAPSPEVSSAPAPATPIKEVKPLEVKVPTKSVDTKKIQTDIKRINDAIQKSIQSDAMMKAYNLGSGIR